MKQPFAILKPWIRNASYDSWFILLPPFVSLFLVMLLPQEARSTDAMPLVYWVLLVLLIDVAHVYSTLFRTYLDPERFRRQRSTFLLVPFLCYIAGVVLHTLQPRLFWTALAYLAVYHFIRQQYGFMRLYARREQASRQERMVDALAIYSACLYPILYWHLEAGRNFTWFVAGDFRLLDCKALLPWAGAAYGLVLLLYLLKEIWVWRRRRSFNLPRNLIIGGTALSWYFGIVYFNGDLAFTLLNVVSHGIPYMALVWTTSSRRPERPKKNYARSLWFFVAVLVLLAYLEEGLWDGLVWKDHAVLFPGFSALPKVQGKEWMALLVPLLSLPQSTHYVLDGFIWRRKDG